MAKAYGFTQTDARRIAETVRRDEQRLPALRQRRNRRGVPEFLPVLGKTDAAINKGSSGTVSVWRGTTKGSETDSTENVTAYNRFADVDSGKWVMLIFVHGGYEMISAEC